MAPVIYGAEFSPPCRAVYMTAKMIGLEIERKDLNMMQGEHLTPEYKKINPNHTIPTMDDSGFILTDSHAITTYLIGKYSKDGGALYPKFLQQRALVDQMLHFDSGVLFPAMVTITKSLFRGVYKEIPSEHSDRLLEVYSFLEQFLERKDFVAGKSISVADIHIVSTMFSSEVVVPLGDKFPNISKWMKRCGDVSNYDHSVGINGAKQVLEMVMNK